MPNPKARILYLIDTFWSPVGGTEQNLFWLLRRIPEEEFEKHCVVFSGIRNYDPNLFPVVPRQLAVEFGFGTKTWFRRIREVAQILNDHQIDLIHAFSPAGELASVLATAWARRGRVVGNRRDIGYHWTRKGKMLSRIVQQFRPRYIANSDAAKQAACQIEGIPLSRIDVIRNPISESRLRDGLQSPLSRSDIRANIPDDAQLVGMIATIRRIKDHPSLLIAAKTVLEKQPNTFFVIVGESDTVFLEELKEQTRRLGIDEKIIWFGALDNPYRILPLLDVAVLSSHSESFSNSVLEYAAAGRAIVVSDVGGLGEIVRQNETGLLVPPQSPPELAAAILRLLEDRSFRESLGSNARNFAFQEFSEQRVLEQYGEVYRRLLS